MPYHNYLACRRKASALTQKELAGLFGTSQSTMSRVERGERAPTVEVALGLQVLFDKQPIAMFPDFYEEVMERVVGAGAELDLSLEGKRDAISIRKREALAAMIKRINPTPAV